MAPGSAVPASFETSALHASLQVQWVVPCQARWPATARSFLTMPGAEQRGANLYTSLRHTRCSTPHPLCRELEFQRVRARTAAFRFRRVVRRTMTAQWYELDKMASGVMLPSTSRLLSAEQQGNCKPKTREHATTRVRRPTD